MAEGRAFGSKSSIASSTDLISNGTKRLSFLLRLSFSFVVVVVFARKQFDDGGGCAFS